MGVGTDSQGPGPTEGKLDGEFVGIPRLDPGVFGAHLPWCSAREAPARGQVGGGEGREGGGAEGPQGDVQVGVAGRGQRGRELEGEGGLDKGEGGAMV